MKYFNKFLFITLSFFLVSSIFTAQEYSLLSWNILGPQAPDINDHFPNSDQNQRMNAVAAIINKFNTDILCLQEVSFQLSENLSPLTKYLHPKYQRATYCNKGKHGGAVIFYDTQKFTLNCYACLDSQNYNPLDKWIEDLFKKEEPKKIFNGVAAFALLETKTTKQKIGILSVHLARGNKKGYFNDNDLIKRNPISNEEKGQAQLKSIFNLLKEFLANNNIKLESLPLIITGDFNTFYQEMAQEVIQYDFLQPLNLNLFDFNSFTVNTKNGLFASIDHVLYSKNFITIDQFKSIADREYIPETNNIKNFSDFMLQKKQRISQKYPSDHLPLNITFTLCEPSTAVAKPAQPMPASKKPTAKLSFNTIREEKEFLDFLKTVKDQEKFLKDIENLKKIINEDFTTNQSNPRPAPSSFKDPNQMFAQPAPMPKMPQPKTQVDNLVYELRSIRRFAVSR